jgi:hypothetical protein
VVRVAHAEPQAEGYAFRARGDDARCPRDLPRAWQATPDWYTARADEFAQRERNVRAEERRAERGGSLAEQAAIEEQARRDRQRLEQDRAAFRAQLPTLVTAARRMSPTLARAAGCRDHGAIESDDGVYALWCCP